jgi:hypothetical protein
MDTRNSYAIVEVLERSSYACTVCMKKLETPPIKLQCGCHIMAHEKCLPSKCLNCKKSSDRRDKILAIVVMLVCCIICIIILVLVLKFGYKVI